MSHLVVDQGVLAALLGACRAAYPREACGLLGGRGGWAHSHYPVPNVARNPARRFHMDPDGQLRAFRQMDERGEELIAIYHSHPSTGAVPSQADLEQAYYPNAFYLIVSMVPRHPEMRAFRLSAVAHKAVEVRWRRSRRRTGERGPRPT